MAHSRSNVNYVEQFIDLLKLAYLAPDIMEASARGDTRLTVALGRLKEGFPLSLAGI